MSTLFHAGRLYRLPGRATAEWLVVDDGRIEAIGSGNAPSADHAVDLGGATLLPAFCDGHVHLPATGLFASGMDLRGLTSADEILARVKARAESGSGILFGGNFEDPDDRSLTRRDLDRVVGSRRALLARADMHSCIVSTELLDQLDVGELEGVDRDEDGPTGYLREKAAAEAWSYFDRHLSADEQIDAVKAAAKVAYSRGVASVHEMFVVEWRGWESLEVFRRALDAIELRVELYVGTDAIDRVSAMGFARIGGDYFLDGSFGSHTAWMTEGYSQAPPEGTPAHGIAYREDDHLFDFFHEAQQRNLQVGVHAIGDAAIEQAIATWEKVSDKVGVEEVKALGHRIEHFECSTDDHFARAARLGLRASVQPAFDAYWGGDEGLYSTRIGRDRALQMNRFASMLTAGLLVGAGSDSTVTPLDPFLQLRALLQHHDPDQRVGRVEALRLVTTGAHALAYGPGLRGTLEPGAPADLVLVDLDPVTCPPDELNADPVIATWIAGRQVWPEVQE